MKFFTTVILLSLFFELSAQDTIVGHYRDNFGSRIELNKDGTFKYTWRFDLVASWTKGTWDLKGDTVYLQMIPIYDTLNQINSSGILSDTLIFSYNETPERVTSPIAIAISLSSGGQNRTNCPDKLLFKKDRLYKIQNDKVITEKQYADRTDDKLDPWYFKSGN